MANRDVLRKLKQDQRKRDKELSKRFDTESLAHEDFHTFKNRVKRPKF